MSKKELQNLQCSIYPNIVSCRREDFFENLVWKSQRFSVNDCLGVLSDFVFEIDFYNFIYAGQTLLLLPVMMDI